MCMSSNSEGPTAFNKWQAQSLHLNYFASTNTCSRSLAALFLHPFISCRYCRLRQSGAS